MIGDLWEVRTLHDGLALELHGNPPALVLVQGSDRIRAELAHVKTVHSAALRDGMIAAMGNAAVDLAGLLLTVILIGRREERQAEAPRLCPVPVAER